MLTESNLEPCVVSSLYILYSRDDTSPELRTQIIKTISLIVDSNKLMIEKTGNIVPINLWIMPPPHLTREGLILIAILLKDLSRNGKFQIKSSLDSILSIIKPPGNSCVPIDNFLELFVTAIENKELNPADLIQKKFIEDFILLQEDETLSKYFEEHLLFRMVVISVYSDDNASEFRFPVLQKFILSSVFLKNVKDIIEFLEALFSKHFSLQIVSLLLSFMDNTDLMNLFENELKKRKEVKALKLRRNI